MVRSSTMLDSLFTILFIASISFVVAYRDIDIGDTARYLSHYNRIYYSSSADYKFEIGFNFFAYLLSRIKFDYVAFFYTTALFISVVYFHLIKLAHNAVFGFEPKRFDIVLSLCLLVYSSWYIVSVSNGLRQGMSLPFLYLALFNFTYNRRIIRGILYLAISISLHYSTVLVVPFLFLLVIPLKMLLVAWILLALGYIFSINEILVFHLSNAAGITLYLQVLEYATEGGEEGRFHGFVLSFFVYTIFWPLALLAMHYIRFRKYEEHSHRVFGILRIYLVLSIPYFVFGFGAFSNRYALIAWFFLPILQFFMLVYYSGNVRRVARIIGLLMFLFSYFYVYYMMNSPLFDQIV